jgi:hypothetical protein
MMAPIKIVVQLLSDVCRFAVLLFRPSGALVAENLFRAANSRYIRSAA